jgi:hypothetical protein
MTQEEREAFYDAEVAPALLTIGKKCQDNGLSFIAVAEWAPGETGRTGCLAEGAGVGIRITELAAQAAGNVDSLILALMKYGREHGHNSMCLHQLGVVTHPNTDPA